MKIEYMQGSNVVAISPIRSRVNFPAISAVEGYWEGLRDGRQMPARAEVDPRGLAEVLEFAFILERVAPGLARIRLAGMHLNDLMGMEVRGMPLTAMFLPEARRDLQRALETVFEEPAVVRMTLASDVGIGRRPLEAQIILLPLTDEAGRITRVLGALQAKGEIGRGPRRFTVRDQETKSLPAVAPPAATTSPAPPVYRQPQRRRAQPTGLSEPSGAFAPRTLALAEELRRAEKSAAEDGRKGPRLMLVHDADKTDA